ncbi:M28 family metallopeptidase [Chungangia koreensis]|uniref:M28 family metallopeptidase n=1 Tax=Chungangia koreensis TaxID=752657 RepID=A0ABV8X8V5_9LACT
MKDHFRLFVILIILFLSLTGCSEEEKVSPEEAIWNEVAYWSSDEFEGRQTGTAANEKVRDEIVKRYKTLELKPVFGENYLQPFNMLFLNPDEIEKRLVIHMQDGTEQEFIYGKDWLERSSEPNIHVELPISFQESKNNILVTEKQLPPSEQIRVQFVKSKSFSKVLTAYNPESGLFQITETLYAYLKENEKKIKKVGLIYSGRRTPITAHNVIGKIAGENSGEKRAIIISAHFDHVGKVGAETIPGSIDNASGLTALLNIAEELAEQSKSQPFSSDIFFAAFNAEESGLLGSQAFVDEISSQYDSMANINLDCIGYKDGGRISITGSNSGSANLSEQLTALAKKSDVQLHHILEDGISLRSDHVSFLDQHYQAINISQEKYPAIHSTEDNMNQVDAGPILKVIELVVDFVNEHQDESFITALKETNDNAYEMESMEHRKELKFGEYKTYQSDVTGNLETVLNLERVMTEEESQPFISALESSGFQLSIASFRYNPMDDFDPTKGNIGEIKKFSNDELKKNVIQVDVKKDEEDLYLQIISQEVKMPFNSEPESFGEWELRAGWDSGKTYSSAFRTMDFQGHTFSILIQGTFSKSTLESFIEAFPIDVAIEMLSQ